jgi:hypothetical protein
MSRSEVINRAADGIMVVLRGIGTGLFDHCETELRRGWCNSRSRSAGSVERTLVTLRLVRATDCRAEIEQGMIELGIRSRLTGELIQIKPDLPSPPVLAPIDPANNSRRCCIEQDGTPIETKAEDGLGEVVSHSRKRAKREFLLGNRSAVPFLDRPCDIHQELGSRTETEARKRLDGVLPRDERSRRRRNPSDRLEQHRDEVRARARQTHFSSQDSPWIHSARSPYVLTTVRPMPR